MKKILILMILATGALAVSEASNDAQAMGKKKNPDLVPPAADSLVLGAALVTGTGCPLGTSRIELSRDNTVLRISLGQMVVESEKSAKAICSIVLPVLAIPAGQRLVVNQVVVEGRYDVAQGMNGKLTHETFLAGAFTGNGEQQKVGSLTEARTGRLEINQMKAAATGCGQPGILRTNTAVELKRTLDSSARTSALQVDELVFELKLESC